MWGATACADVRSRPGRHRRPPRRSTTPSDPPSGSTPPRRSSDAPVATAPCPRNRRPTPSARKHRTRQSWCRRLASSPTTRTPASAHCLSVRLRFVARATGTRAAAPALVRQATAVTDAERRCGISTPCPPKAATERMMAPEVARIGNVVQRNQQCGLDIAGGRGQQIVGVGVRVRRNLQRDALMQAIGTHPVEVVAGHLQDRDAAIGGQRHRFGQPLIGLGAECDVQSPRRRVGPQAFQYRVAAQNHLGFVGGLVVSLAGLLGGTFCRGVMGPLVSGRGGAPPFEPAPADTSGAHCRALLGALLADCAAPLRIARHLVVPLHRPAPIADRRRCRLHRYRRA